jgi:hypothetical protein
MSRVIQDSDAESEGMSPQPLQDDADNWATDSAWKSSGINGNNTGMKIIKL